VEAAVLGSFVGGNLELRNLELRGVDMRIVRDEEGRFNLSDATPDVGDDPGAVPDFEFSEVSVHYFDESADVEVAFSDCAGSVSGAGMAQSGELDRFARLEGEGEIRCRSIRYGEVEFSEVEINLSAGEGRIALDPFKAVLYEGTGLGSLEADLSGERPRFSLNVTLEEFEAEGLLHSLAPEVDAEGVMIFSTELSSAGSTIEAVERELEGSISLRGEAFTVHGIDLDERFADFASVREFGLVDAGAVLLIGPAGLAVTRGHEFARLLRAGEGSTEFREVVSDWTVAEGAASTEDVAIATEEHRLAVRGRIDFTERVYDGVSIALLDPNGCAVVEQAVTGPFTDPEIDQPGVVETLLAPVMDLVQRGIAPFVGDDCEVFYEGEVSAP